MNLPGPEEAVTAGRETEFLAVTALAEKDLPPLYRTGLVHKSLRIVYLVPRTEPGERRASCSNTRTTCCVSGRR